jgi:hypothetical protein
MNNKRKRKKKRKGGTDKYLRNNAKNSSKFDENYKFTDSRRLSTE